MADVPWGPIIAGGAGIAGAYLGSEAEKDAAAANRDISHADRLARSRAAHLEYQRQKEFAQMGIQWKMADAKAAGIHPLYAMGGSGAGYSPASWSSDSIPEQPRRAAAEGLASAGQDISRALMATRSTEEREMFQLQKQSIAADIQGKNLSNQLRAEELKQLHDPSIGGGDTNFIPGQGNSNLMKVIPSQRPHSQPGAPHQEAGWVQDIRMGRTSKGLDPMIPQSSSESYEADVLGGIKWGIRNHIMPLFGGTDSKPPRNQLPRGATDWKYSFLYGWKPVYGRDRGVDFSKKYPPGVPFR